MERHCGWHGQFVRTMAKHKITKKVAASIVVLCLASGLAFWFLKSDGMQEKALWGDKKSNVSSRSSEPAAAYSLDDSHAQIEEKNDMAESDSIEKRSKIDEFLQQRQSGHAIFDISFLSAMEQVLLTYESFEGGSLKEAGYLDLWGGVWSCVIQQSDMVTICIIRDKQSSCEISTVCMNANDWEQELLGVLS